MASISSGNHPPVVNSKDTHLSGFSSAHRTPVTSAETIDSVSKIFTHVTLYLLSANIIAVPLTG